MNSCFSNYKIHTIVHKINAKKQLRKVLIDLGIDALTLHGLRPTYASVLLYKRLSLTYVTESLGHKSTIRTPQDYAHVLTELKQEAGEKSLNVFDNMVS